jgi:class 3 adenylate cyclase
MHSRYYCLNSQHRLKFRALLLKREDRPRDYFIPGSTMNMENRESKMVDFSVDVQEHDAPDDHSSSSNSGASNLSRGDDANGRSGKKTFVSMGLILFLGSTASAIFLTFSVLSSNRERRQVQFDQQASELVTEIGSTWNDYEYAGLWIHEACRARNITRQEFRELYEYTQSEGLDFQAAEFILNVTHGSRDEIEADAESYYAANYPDINYRGIIGFEPVSPGSDELSIQERSDQPFYFIVQNVEPVEANAAAIHLDLYSSAKRRKTIESALETWEPALTDRLHLVQETDESAYSVLLMHPGIPLVSAPQVKPRDLSLLVIRIPSFLARATREQSENLVVYLYDTTQASDENPPQFLGGAKVSRTDTDAASVEFVEEIEFDDLLDQETPVDIYTDIIRIASSTWEVVVVPLDDTFQATFDLEILGGVLLFIGTLAVAFWLYTNMVRNNEINNIQARAEAERSIVRSLFPSNVRDRIIEGATRFRKKGPSIRLESSARTDGSSDQGSETAALLTSEKIFGSKPIADFFTEVTVIFADLVGFTAWSSARNPTQVFALLEVIYHSFDLIAQKRHVFKLETVGDCYVAACGIPEPRDDHAEVMATFATECLLKLHELISALEISMGPDTADLDIRIGLHSGPVTAGVLRGDKGRFQLFGDTMNTANRIETTGSRSKIHVSFETAELLKKAGRAHWVTEREDSVFAKGKGRLKTYWLDTSASSPEKVATSNSIAQASSRQLYKEYLEDRKVSPVLALKENNHNKRMERLIDWCVDVFARLLRGIVAKRQAQTERLSSPNGTRMLDSHPSSSTRAIGGRRDLLEEVRDVIVLPEFDGSFEGCTDPDTIKLDPDVEKELHEFMCVIAELYQRNPFHNFEHAGKNHIASALHDCCTHGINSDPLIMMAIIFSALIHDFFEHTGHVLMSVCKLFTRIVSPAAAASDDLHADGRESMHDNTFGIASDPLTRFACAFAALIHDVDHPGVPNSTLVSENTVMAVNYGNKSVAEQNSIDTAWDLLMSDRHSNLVECLCPSDGDLRRFRQLVVNMVMATDIMDKDVGAQRKARWEKAFSEQSTGSDEDTRVDVNRKATIVIEHLIQASDVSHTMQHWHVFRKWNELLFYEMYSAYKSGRLEFDPSEKWYEGEIGFFDFYIIPLAKKLDTCGVFGVSSDELLSYAELNRREWEEKGKDIVRSYVETYHERYE